MAKILILLSYILCGIAAAQTPANVIERDYYGATLKAHVGNERFFPRNGIVFFGDSIIQNLDLSVVARDAINFGISGDTSYGVAFRMRNYGDSIKGARAVVLQSGINDLGFGEKFDAAIPENFKKMLSYVPWGKRVFIVGLPPVDESKFPAYETRILAVNGDLKKVCRATLNCKFIDLKSAVEDPKGLGMQWYRMPDGIHLAISGRRVFYRLLKKNIAQ